MNNAGGRERCPVDHEALKQDEARWSALEYRGLQRTYDEPGFPTHLELRNCECGTTLGRPVYKRMQFGKVVESTPEAAALELEPGCADPDCDGCRATREHGVAWSVERCINALGKVA